MNKMKTANLLILITLIIILLLFSAYMWPVIFQEGNPLPIFWGLIRIELTSRKLVAVTDYKLIQKTGPETALSEYMADYGWQFKDRLGAGIFYHRNNTELFVEARMLSRFYTIYELDLPLQSVRKER